VVINISQVIPCIYVVLISLLVDILLIIVHLHLLFEQLFLCAFYLLRSHPRSEPGSFMPGYLLTLGDLEFQIICRVRGSGRRGLELPAKFLINDWP
jgi:hypothetical protein